jgi:hypothetical protein
MEKIVELEGLGVPYVIVCGERLNQSRVVYRASRGKYDAINFGAKLVPRDVNIVVMNDVDTKIHNFPAAIQHFKDEKADTLFATEMVRGGPQSLFFRLFNPIRRRVPLAGSGELMLINRHLLERILPLKPCKAEDTYILFKTLELGHKVVFCEECFAETERTKTAEKEEAYKRKTVTGIYQALSYSKPPKIIRVFYFFLPLMCPLLLVLGRKGYYWARGILLGLIDYIRGDRIGFWQPTYME